MQIPLWRAKMDINGRNLLHIHNLRRVGITWLPIRQPGFQ